MSDNVAPATELVEESSRGGEFTIASNQSKVIHGIETVDRPRRSNGASVRELMDPPGFRRIFFL